MADWASLVGSNTHDLATQYGYDIGDIAKAIRRNGYDIDATGKVIGAIPNFTGAAPTALPVGNMSTMTNPTASGTYQNGATNAGSSAAFGGSPLGSTAASMGGAANGGMPGGAGGMGGGSSFSTNRNPYLREMGDWLTDQMTQNFERRVMPSMNSGVMAAGGYGGSRHGVLQANANNDLQHQIGGALTNLYGQGFNTQMQSDLGWGNLQASYDLGRRNNDLGFAGLDRQINNDNLNWQLQGAQFGLGLYDRMNANNQGIYGVGQNIQNTPLNYWQMFSDQSNAFGQGYGTQTNTMPTQGNPMMGAMGGMQMGSQLGRMWGGNSWMGGGSNPNVAGDAYMPAYQPLSGITF